MKMGHVFFAAMLAYLTAGEAAAPSPVKIADEVSPPKSGFSYSGVGSDKLGNYHIYQQYITSPNQTGKNPKAWILVTRDVPEFDEGRGLSCGIHAFLSALQ